MAQFAQSRGVTEIKVEQICERSQHNEGDEDDDDEQDDDDNQYGEQDGGGRYLVWAFSTHKTESTVKFNGTEKHTVSILLSLYRARKELMISSLSQRVNPGKTQYHHTASHSVLPTNA
jgi:hypothetical protein